MNEDCQRGKYELIWMWKNNIKQKSDKYVLHPDLLREIYRKIQNKNLTKCKLTGFTKMRTQYNDLPCVFHAHPWFGGGPWYDWAYVELMEDDVDGKEVKMYYPSLILGFIKFTDEDEHHAVIQISTKDLPWETRQKEFISSFLLSTNFKTHYVTVSVSSVVHHLCAFADYGGINDKFFTPLSKRKWAQCFHNKINVTTDHLDLVESEVEDYHYDEEGDILHDDEEEESLYDDEDGEEELI